MIGQGRKEAALPTFTGVYSSDIGEVRRALDHHYDPNGDHTRRGYTPLARAVNFRRIGIVRLLLEAGANPNAGIPHQTPLYIAVND
jgi:ankyrin repeat protein